MASANALSGLGGVFLIEPPDDDMECIYLTQTAPGTGREKHQALGPILKLLKTWKHSAK